VQELVVAIQYDSYTGQPVHGGRVLFVRVPRDYTVDEQPGINEVAAAFAHTGADIVQVTAVDHQGGFLAVIGGDLGMAHWFTQAIVNAFHGKANLQGEECISEAVPVHERVCGALIGHKGENLRAIKAATGAHIDVSPWSGRSATRTIQLRGSRNSVAGAKHHINQSLMAVLAQQQGSQQSAGSSAQPTQAPMQAVQQLERTFSTEFPRLGADSPMPTNPMAAPSLPSPLAVAPQPPIHFLTTTAMVLPLPGMTSTIPPAPSAPVYKGRPPALLKAHWCLLKDRASIMADVRLGVKVLSAPAMLVDSLAVSPDTPARRGTPGGLQFGLRSKSWAHFMGRREMVEGVWEEANQTPSLPVKPAKQLGLGITRTCSSDALRGAGSGGFGMGMGLPLYPRMSVE